jgi:hypothetical protein
MPYTHLDLEADLQGRSCSFDHHSRYSNVNAEQCLNQINADLSIAAAHLRSAKFLFLTLGTAWGYSHRPTSEEPDQPFGPVVANCHQLPRRDFAKWMARPSEITDALRTAIDACLHVNPVLQVVVTVSPVRHWRDGPVENSRSKASLLLAVDELLGSGSPRVTYFPSYELVLDDLRDYRFFNEVIYAYI